MVLRASGTSQLLQRTLVLEGWRLRGGAAQLISPRRRRGVVTPADLIDILSEGSDLLGEVPEPRIDFVFQGHQNRGFVFIAYTFRRDESPGALFMPSLTP